MKFWIEYIVRDRQDFDCEQGWLIFAELHGSDRRFWTCGIGTTRAKALARLRRLLRKMELDPAERRALRRVRPKLRLGRHAKGAAK